MNENVYTTSDLNEAVLLRYFGHRLRFVDGSQKRAVFHFDLSYDTEKIMNEYRRGEVLVEPRSFYLCQREVKDRLYNG